MYGQVCNKIVFLALIYYNSDITFTEVNYLFYSLQNIIIAVKHALNSCAYFAPIMPAFCSLLFASYYSKNFAGKIDSSLYST